MRNRLVVLAFLLAFFGGASAVTAPPASADCVSVGVSYYLFGSPGGIGKTCVVPTPFSEAGSVSPGAGDPSIVWVKVTVWFVSPVTM